MQTCNTQTLLTALEKTPSKSLLDVGVEGAMADSGFDENMFKGWWVKVDQAV